MKGRLVSHLSFLMPYRIIIRIIVFDVKCSLMFCIYKTVYFILDRTQFSGEKNEQEIIKRTMKILITGICGFVGSTLAKEWLNAEATRNIWSG